MKLSAGVACRLVCLDTCRGSTQEHKVIIRPRIHIQDTLSFALVTLLTKLGSPAIEVHVNMASNLKSKWQLTFHSCDGVCWFVLFWMFFYCWALCQNENSYASFYRHICSVSNKFVTNAVTVWVTAGNCSIISSEILIVGLNMFCLSFISLWSGLVLKIKLQIFYYNCKKASFSKLY